MGIRLFLVRDDLDLLLFLEAKTLGKTLLAGVRASAGDGTGARVGCVWAGNGHDLQLRLLLLLTLVLMRMHDLVDKAFAG